MYVYPSFSIIQVSVIGDDIAWLRPDASGQLRAINPENGFFGVAPGTNQLVAIKIEDIYLVWTGYPAFFCYLVSSRISSNWPASFLVASHLIVHDRR